VPQHLNFSRAARIQVDEKAMTFEEVWTSETERTEGSCYNWAMGEAETLPMTGNTLLVRANCTPQDPSVSDFNEFDLSKRFVDELYGDAFVDQYTKDNPSKRVARYRFSNPDQIMSWTLYGGFHRSSVAGGK
jgi:arylsulfate sulfotransferase